MTRSSPSAPWSAPRALRLKGTPMIHRSPVTAGCQRDNVTVPITSATRMALKLPKKFRDLGRTDRLARESRSQDLPDFKERAPRHFDNQHVGAQARKGPCYLGAVSNGGCTQAR